jgi:hypothetical protein
MKNFLLGSVVSLSIGFAFYYTPRYTSPLRGKGLVFDWMAGSEDIAGNPRLREGLADIGAYQCWIKPPWTTIVVR